MDPREQRRQRKIQRLARRRRADAAARAREEQARRRPVVPGRPAVAERHLAAITAHVERHVGPVASVVHELRSELIHVDVLQVAPTAQRPFWTLVTSGMSDAPMRVQRCCAPAQPGYAELVLCLPSAWRPDPRDPRCAWPYPLLQDLARQPHATDSWLGWGHTWETPWSMGPGVPFVGAVFLPPATLPEEFATGLVVEGRQIDMLAVALLRRDELQHALSCGVEALLQRAPGALSEVVDLRRPSVLRRPSARRDAG